MNLGLVIPLFLLPALVAAQALDSTITIEVVSNYDGATVLLDGISTYRSTPAHIPGVSAGEHIIRLTWDDGRADYAAEDTVIVGPDSRRFEVNFEPVDVTIVCNAPHTKLYLNGHLKGDGKDLVIEGIIPGTYKLMLIQPFGNRAEKDVYFPPNRSDCPTECFVFGNLRVESDEEPEALIYINGQETTRRIPAVFENLIIGEYEVGIKRGSHLVTRKGLVRTSAETEVRINPKEIERETDSLRLVELEMERRRLELAKKEERERAIQTNIQERQAAERRKSVPIRLPSHVGWGIGPTFTGGVGVDDGDLGFSFSWFFDFPILNGLFVRNELNYSTRNFSYNTSELGVTYERTDLECFSHQVLIGVYPGSDLYFAAGLQAGKIVGKARFENFQYHMPKAINFSWAAVIGLGFPTGVSSQLSLSRNLTNPAPHQVKRNLSRCTMSLDFLYAIRLGGRK